MITNYWLSVSSAIYSDIELYIKNPESYTGSSPVADIMALLEGLYDPLTVFGLFKPYNGRHLITVYVSVSEVFGGLMQKYPDTIVLGSWGMDGEPFLEPHLDTINYMPMISVPAGNDEYTLEPATELTQVNLLGGQQARYFVIADWNAAKEVAI